MLISLMSNTFTKIQEMGDISYLREIISMIEEYIILVDFKSDFFVSRYIIRASLEKDKGNPNNNTEYIVEKTRGIFDEKFDELNKMFKKLPDTAY